MPIDDPCIAGCVAIHFMENGRILTTHEETCRDSYYSILTNIELQSVSNSFIHNHLQ